MVDFKMLKFDEKGLLPVIVQEYGSNKILMLAYMNEEALNKTFETGLAHYYSRSRKQLWLKGETSGHYQHICEISLDCDQDTLLILVKQEGSACHTGNKTCFYRNINEKGEFSDRVDSEDKSQRILRDLYDIVSERRENPKEGSYTNYLFNKGIDKILKKVGEECAEVIIAAKNASLSELRYEMSDLFYHLTVLMIERGLTLEEIYQELDGRKK